MQVKGTFIFMGTEKTTSRDGKNDYYKIGLIQGLDSEVFYVDKPVFDKYSNIPVATPITADINIVRKEGKTYLGLIDLQVTSVGNVSEINKKVS